MKRPARRKLAFRCPDCKGRRFNTVSSVGQTEAVYRTRRCRYCAHDIWTEERVISWNPGVGKIEVRYQRDRQEERVHYVANP